MDGPTFDELAKRLTQGRLTRVALLRGVAASALGGVLGATRDKAAAQPKPKVTLCHNGQPREVAESAVQAHLDHGDTLGPCVGAEPGGCAGVTDGPDPSGQCSWCCQGSCCLSPANQCNVESGLCCAPNCANRECGDDGCGNGRTCGCGAGATCTRGGVCPAGQECACPTGQVCNPASGQCGGPPCQQQCPVSESCTGRQCACASFGSSVAPATCCPARSSGELDEDVCNIAGLSPDFVVADTCAQVATCPSGYTPCVGPTNNGCQACCPPGTTCDPQGFCRQASCCPPTS